MDLGIPCLSEIRQMKKDKYPMILHLYVESKKDDINELTQNRDRITDIENKLTELPKGMEKRDKLGVWD